MAKTAEQLQRELDREMDYTRKLNDKITYLQEKLKNSISITEHEKKIAELKREYKRQFFETSYPSSCIHNERGAGRRKVASREIAEMVLELNKQGLSQAKIAVKLSDELNIKIGRTTVGEIVRGNYTLP